MIKIKQKIRFVDKKKLSVLLIIIIFMLASDSNSLIINQLEEIGIIEEGNNLNSGVVPVKAKEEDETDNFNIMPNYRYVNETVTGDMVTEQITGGSYGIYSVNNETSGYQDLTKSRKLVGRDIEFDSRFNIETGGNEIEYFRDVLGDACDFEEGDNEDFYGAGGSIISNDGGILEFTCNADYGGIKIDTIPDQSVELLTKIIVRGKTSISAKMVMWLYTGGDKHTENAYNSFTNEWSIVEFIFDGFVYNTFGNYISFTAHPEVDIYPFTVWVDYIEIITELDYASHINDEIEDTWDWEDSLEFFYDDYGNVSDWNDGSLEIASVRYNCSIANVDSWLDVYHTKDTSNDSAVTFNPSGDIVGDYKYFAMEIYYVTNAVDDNPNLTSILVYDGDDQLCLNDTTGWVNNTYDLIDGELDNWYSGGEDRFYIIFNFDYDSSDTHVYLNMIYLYDCLLGDLEGVIGLASHSPYAYVNPEGYLVHPVIGNDPHFQFQSLDINGNIFDYLKIRAKIDKDVFVGNIKIFWWYNEGADYDHTDMVGILTDDWLVFTLDFSQEENWVGETISILRFDIPSNAVDTYYSCIDYILLEGNWSSTEGFAWNILTDSGQNAMEIKFTKPVANINNYLVNVSLNDITGVVLTTGTLFDYNPINDWLNIKLRFDMDKKRLLFTLEYDNGTDIIKERSLYSMFGATGRGGLLIDEKGFPSLCINNTVGSMGRSLVYINYIDANWDLANWEILDGTFTRFNGTGGSIGASSTASQLSESGIEIDNDGIATWFYGYSMSLTRFDGLNYNSYVTVDNIDNADNCLTGMQLSGVTVEGETFELFEINMQSQGIMASGIWFYTYTDNYTYGSYGATGDIGDLDISIYNDYDNSKIILQYSFTVTVTSTGNSYNYQGTRIIVDSRLTKEFVLIKYYQIETDDSTGAVFIETTRGMDIKRKDLIGAIVSFIAPVIDNFFAMVLTPVIAFFSLILKGIVTVGEVISVIIGAVIQVAITGLEGVITSVVGSVETVLGTAIGLVETAVDAVITTLEGIAEDIFEYLFTIVEDMSIFMQELLIELSGIAADIIIAYIDVMMAVYEQIINEVLLKILEEIALGLGIEDLFYYIIDFVTSLVEIIADLFVLIGWVTATIFAYGAFWLSEGRFESAVMVISLIVGIWVSLDIIIAFGKFSRGTLTGEDLVIAFEKTFGKLAALSKVLYTIIIFLLDLAFRIVNAIGNYIPFT